jgi:hypothetical protein
LLLAYENGEEILDAANPATPDDLTTVSSKRSTFLSSLFLPCVVASSARVHEPIQASRDLTVTAE